MQTEATRAMTSWIGSLASGGVIRDAHERAGMAVAAYVVGEQQMAELRAWMRSCSPEEMVDAQRAAIEICIWMANADRRLASEEAALLEQLIAYSRLPLEVQEELIASVREPASLKRVEHRVTHAALRELLLALGWELAAVDGRIHHSEEAFITGLAKRFGVSLERLDELRRAVAAQVLVQ